MCSFVGLRKCVLARLYREKLDCSKRGGKGD